MTDTGNQKINQKRKDSARRHTRMRLGGLLAMLTLLLTCGALIRPAAALSRTAHCGLEEHIHTEDCYDGGELICGLEEHTHTESCFSDSAAEEPDSAAVTEISSVNPASEQPGTDLEESLPADASGDDAEGTAELSRQVRANDDGSFTLRLEAYVTGESVETLSSRPVDVVLIFNTSGSTKNNRLGTASVDFIDRVAAASDYDDPSTISIIECSDAETTDLQNSVWYNGLTAEQKAQLEDLDDSVCLTYHTGSSAAPWEAFARAMEVLYPEFSSEETRREKAVIFITDGEPAEEDAGRILEAVGQLRDKGTAVYAVGMFSEAAQETVNFLGAVSTGSTDRAAQAELSAGDCLIVCSANGDVSGYSAADLSDAVRSISRHITGSIADLDETTVLKSVIPENFRLDADDGQTPACWTEECTAVDENGTPTAWTMDGTDTDPAKRDGIKITVLRKGDIDPETNTAATQDVVTITGFSYRQSPVGRKDDTEIANSDGNYTGRGRRLVMELKLRPDFVAGDGYLPETSDPESGIYKGGQKLFSFVQPVETASDPAEVTLQDAEDPQSLQPTLAVGTAPETVSVTVKTVVSPAGGTFDYSYRVDTGALQTQSQQGSGSEYTVCEIPYGSDFTVAAPNHAGYYLMVTDEEGRVISQGADVTLQDLTEDRILTYTFTPGTELPSTGGTGTGTFAITGSILVVLAVVLFITKKRMER